MISKNELDYRWSLYGLLSRLYRLEADAALLDTIRALLQAFDGRVVPGAGSKPYLTMALRPDEKPLDAVNAVVQVLAAPAAP